MNRRDTLDGIRSAVDRKDVLGVFCSAVVLFFGIIDQWYHSAILCSQEYYSVVLSSILAVIGVSITGYIFLIEYLRRLKTDRPIYKDAAEQYQRGILAVMKVMFWYGVVLGAACTVLIGGPDLSAVVRGGIGLAVLFLFVLFLFKTIRTDMRMMNPENKINDMLEGERKSAFEEIKNTDLIARLNSDEYREITASPEFIRGIPEFSDMYGTSEKKVHDRPNIITFIHGSDTENMRVKYGKETVKNTMNILGYRDNSDEYDVRNVLNIFSDVETLLCRMIGVEEETVPENISIGGILSGSSLQFKEIGLANDIEWYYSKIRRYRDYYMLTYNKEIYGRDDEKESKRHRPRGKIKKTDYGKDECVLSGPWFIINEIREDTDMSAKVSFEGWIKELKGITPMVFLLRYEISKKLSMMNISDMTLPNYDFSYANMRNASMRNSYLANASFFHADLSSANLSGSNLREVDFKRSTCEGTNMSGCEFYKNSFAESRLAGSVIAGASVSNCLFPEISMNNCNAGNAVIIDCRLIKCNLSGSSFYETSVNSSVVDDCAMHNSNLGSVKIVDCSLSGNAFNGSLFTDGVINRSSISKSTFINTKMTGSEMSALLITQSDFSNSEMQRINFTETQIMAAEFKSSRLDASLFNKSRLGPFSLPPDDKARIRDGGTETIESSVVIFDHSSLRGCHFTESDISCALIRYAILEGAEFNNTSISNSSFEGSDMKGTVIIDSRIDECDLLNLSFEGASLTNTAISDCRMTNCNMKGASLSDVALKNTDIKDTSMSNVRIVKCTFDGVTGINYHLLLSAEVLYNISFKSCTDVDGDPIPDTDEILDVKGFINDQLKKKGTKKKIP